VIKINKIALAPRRKNLSIGCAIQNSTLNRARPQISCDIRPIIYSIAIAVDSIPRRKPTLSKAIAAPLACNPTLDHTVQAIQNQNSHAHFCNSFRLAQI
jgi:hypothetical protein